jgi:protein-disulfide isomerase
MRDPADDNARELVRMMPRRRLALATLNALVLLTALGFAHDALATADASQLSLPAGVNVGVVVFEDLQCPDCAQAHPQLLQTARATGVPLLIYDFPIQRHVWAFPAAILARYFSQQSPALGLAFREAVFAHQKEISTDTLREFAERFAADHHTSLPAEVDADGRLMSLVQADYELGQKIGLEYVPLVFVIGRDAGSVEVKDFAQLATVIDNVRTRQAAH